MRDDKHTDEPRKAHCIVYRILDKNRFQKYIDTYMTICRDIEALGELNFHNFPNHPILNVPDEELENFLVSIDGVLYLDKGKRFEKLSVD